MNVDELLDENRVLRERVATLEAHIHAGINCGFFCALPECAKFLSGEANDKDSTDAPRGPTVASPSCSTGDQPGQRQEVACGSGAPGGSVVAF
jgi:hypothetical protein